MKKLTIKLKITLWFAIFMIILSAVAFAFIAFVSGSTMSQHIRGALTGIVANNMEEVEYDDGELDIDDDFVYFQNGVYCLIFDSSGKRLSGYAPYPETGNQPFDDGSIRSVHTGGENYLIYDRRVSSRRYPDLWVRGIVLENGNALTSSAVYQATLIVLPLLILLAIAGGYLLAWRSLLPIQKISKTAEDIGRSGDLSKRIELAGDNKDELHQLADTFNSMFDRLASNFEAERNFTSDASHELRTPLTIILAQCEYAFENASGEQELYESIGAIQKQGYRMSSLIESMLQFTRMEQRTEVLTFEILDLSSLVLSVCREHQETAEKSITLTEYVQPNVKIKADMLLITHMFENLIRNAYNYGKDNGNITVELKESNGIITLSVSDDGIGISDNDLPNIWNRFYRADKSRSKINGTGLGLAIVKQIAELHGGKIWVESRLGSGSIFTVAFRKT